jgi:phosphoglycerate dehydrogenase-like enzyme
MKIAAGKCFVEQWRDMAGIVCPNLEWAVFSPDNPRLPGDCEAAVLIGDSYTPEFKEQLLKIPSLRWVHTENAGIDSPFYQQLVHKGIILTRSAGANAPEVAEFVFALILNEIKQLEKLKRNQCEHRWERIKLDGLNGQTILILGLGEIGGRVARIADAFGMHVLGIRRAADAVHGVTEQGTPVNLHSFLSRADIIVLSLPLTSETKHLLGESEFLAMKETALLINIARGDIINTAAMKAWLRKRPSFKACLDVLPEEPWPANDELWDFENVFLTPHTAWSSPAYRIRAGKMWLENLQRYTDGRDLLYM